MGCIKCPSGAWVCGPEDNPDCGGLEALTRPPTNWRYDRQEHLAKGRWWIVSEPACKGVTISPTETTGAWYIDVEEKDAGHYIVLCQPGGGGSGPSRVGLVKTKTP